MRPFDIVTNNIICYKEFTYEDLVKALKELFTEGTQKDTKSVSFRNHKTN